VTWVSWRLQRAETVIAAAVLAVLATLLVPDGLNMASTYAHQGLSECVGKETSFCREAVSGFDARFSTVSQLLTWLNIVPGIIGVLLAASLLLDLENGTVRLAWTQSITRTRWLATRLAVAIAIALLSAAALTALVTWWRGPLDRLNGRMTPDVFDYEGIVGFGYVLFAFALALAIGALWRRTVPAIMVGFAAYIAARLFTQRWLRERYLTPLSRIFPFRGHGPNLTHAWVIVGVPSDRLGHAISVTPALVQACTRVVGATVRNINAACLARHGAGYDHVIYQPAGRFWALQGIETTIFAGSALALIALAAWSIHQRAS
jgi:hypothetical protein